MMKTVSRFVPLLVLATLVGCSKSKEAQFLPQTDPAPNPTTPAPSPTPHPTLGPSPVPSASPVPNPSPTPVACDPAQLKAFADNSLFAATTAKVTGMNVSHGVVSPSLNLDEVDLGYGLGRDGGRYDVVGDKIDLRNVEVENGGLAYGTSVKFHEGATVFGVVKKTSPVDYAGVQAYAAALRARLLALPANGTVTVVCPANAGCRAILKGTSPTVNRFTLTVAQMSQLKKDAKIIVDVPKHAAAVVVLQATSLTFDDITVDAPAETVWTLAGTGGTFKLDFLTLTGTVLIPESNFEIEDALLMGRVISNTFKSSPCNRDDAVCATIDSQEMPDSVCL